MSVDIPYDPKKTYPACVNCKSCGADPKYPKTLTCYHPSAYSYTETIDLISGQVTKHETRLFCSTARRGEADEKSCGTIGKFFEQKPEQPKKDPEWFKIYRQKFMRSLLKCS